MDKLDLDNFTPVLKRPTAAMTLAYDKGHTCVYIGSVPRQIKQVPSDSWKSVCEWTIAHKGLVEHWQ